MSAFGVRPIPGEVGRYHVLSGKSKALYLVDLDDLDGGCCGCRDFEVRSGMMLYPAPDCKHLRLARVYRKLQQTFARAMA